MSIKQGNKSAHWLIPTRNNVKVFIEKIKEYLVSGKIKKINQQFYSEASVLGSYSTVIKLYVKTLSMNIEALYYIHSSCDWCHNFDYHTEEQPIHVANMHPDNIR